MSEEVLQSADSPKTITTIKETVKKRGRPARQEGFSKQDVASIAAEVARAVLAEANKPKPKTDQELAEIAQAQQHRKDTADSFKQQRKNKRWFQENSCTHEHKAAAGGGTHCVHVRDNDHPDSPGFVYCQNCEGRFRPDTTKWRKLDPEAIFDTAKFNFLFQQCAGAQGEILG